MIISDFTRQVNAIRSLFTITTFFILSHGFYSSTSAQISSLPVSYIDTTQMGDEEMVKAMVSNFLTAAGNYDYEAMTSMFTKKANIASASFHSGAWRTAVYTFDEWIAGAKAQTNPKPFKEPATDFITQIDGGHLAYVRAEALLYRDNIAVSDNKSYFILLKENGLWKIVSASYAATPVENK